MVKCFSNALRLEYSVLTCCVIVWIFQKIQNNQLTLYFLTHILELENNNE
jgi:hypothetical protein